MHFARITVRWYCFRAKGEKRTKALQFQQIARLLNCFSGRSKTSALQSYKTVNFLFINLSAWFSPLYRQTKRTDNYYQSVFSGRLYLTPSIYYIIIHTNNSNQHIYCLHHQHFLFRCTAKWYNQHHM